MLNNPSLSAGAYDALLGRFAIVLRRECEKRDYLLLRCGRLGASTKTCFDCQIVRKAINPNITLNDGARTRPGCGVFHDRDANAAWNIRVTALTGAIQDFTLFISTFTSPETGDGATSSQVQVFNSMRPDLRLFIIRFPDQ